MDRASQTEAVLQKKALFSSSVSTNSVDIDNPVPQEGGLEKVSGAIKKYLLLTLRCADQQRDATHELVRDRFRSLFRCHAIVVAREPLNGGGFHLIAGVWNTSASKHSAAKRVQDCFVEWAGWDGHRSSLLQGLVDSLYNPFIKGSEAPHLG